MSAHLKDYEVMTDTKITKEGLVKFCVFSNYDLISYEETSDEKWIQAMNEEIQSIEKNNK